MRITGEFISGVANDWAHVWTRTSGVPGSAFQLDSGVEFIVKPDQLELRNNGVSVATAAFDGGLAVGAREVSQQEIEEGRQRRVEREAAVVAGGDDGLQRRGGRGGAHVGLGEPPAAGAVQLAGGLVDDARDVARAHAERRRAARISRAHVRLRTGRDDEVGLDDGD